MDKSNNLVSIIVRTKDRPDLLKKALQSIGAQTHRTVEVVLVNDGGCDLDIEDLKAILGDISLNYIRLKENRGRAFAGNTGIKNASGKYIGFLDDDDQFYENHLDILVNFLEKADAKVAYSDATIGYGDNGSQNKVKSDSAAKVFSSYDFSYNDLLTENYIPLMCILFNGELLQKSGGFDESFDLYEDWDLLLRIGRNNHFKHLNTVTAIYNLWSQSEQIANIEGKEDVRRKAYEHIFYKHLKNFTPDVILDLKKKRENVDKEYTKLISSYKKLEEDTRTIIGKLNETEKEVGSLGKIKYELELKNDNLLSENSYLKTELGKMVDTLGWRILTKIRGFRDLLIPYDTRRRDIYNKFILILKNKKAYKKALGVIPALDTKRQYHKWINEKEPNTAVLNRQRQDAKNLKYQPKISIIVPVYKPEKEMLESMLKSVLSQTYEKWELCIADGNSGKETRDILLRYSGSEKRIKITFLSENKHISGNSNEALSLASGEFVSFLDQDDELSPDALYEVVLLLNSNPKADIIYSDEDKINVKGERCNPFFKPNWSPDLLLSVNYICHFSVVRASIIREIDGFRVGYEGAQDYDLILRSSAKTDKIFHLPKILYHWRMHEGSTSLDVGTKGYSHKSGEKAVEDYLKSRGIHVRIKQGHGKTNYRVRYRIDSNPSVSIIIPFRDKVKLLKKCITSIIEKTEHKNYEIILVSNLSKEKETTKYIDFLLAEYSNISFFEFNEEFNFSKVNNFAVKQTKGEYLIFLNNDTEVISPDWIDVLLENAQREEIGAVGCKLLFPDKTIQHAGVILGMTGFAGHVFAGLPEHSYTYFGSTDFVRNVLAVTGACMMIRRELFERVGGFNETLVLCGSDVDICIRFHEMGYRNIYIPHAVLYHHESVSRKGCPIPQNDFRLSYDIYSKFLEQGDPFYNPNLTLLRTDCSLSSVNEENILKETVNNALG